MLGANTSFRTARAFQSELEKNGAYSNASTSVYDVTYEIECASFEADRVLDLLVRGLENPVFKKSEFKAEFGNVEAYNMVTPKPVNIFKLSPPATRDFADPAKLARHGPFDWNKYTPIIVEENNGILTIQDGMTRVENARRAGITELPAYVFPRR